MHPRRWGLSVPLDSIPLTDQIALFKEAEEAGFTDAWSLEVDGVDCFTPLVLAAGVTKHMRLGTAIANVYTRGPGTLAVSAAGVAEVAPGRFCLGLGAGSQPIVEGWNSGRFALPRTRMQDMVTVLRSAFQGERVSAQLKTLRVEGLRLTRPPAEPIPIYVAALRERMLQLAGEAADGVILNWLAPEDVPRSLAVVRAAAKRAGRDPDQVDAVCRIFVYVDEVTPELEVLMRRHIAGYLNVAVYREFHRWLGRGEALAAMNQAWDSGDRKAAVAAIPPEVVGDLLIFGPPEHRRERIAAYLEAGVAPIIHLISTERDPQRRAEALVRGLRESYPPA